MNPHLRGIVFALLALIPWSVRAEPHFQRFAQEYVASLKAARKPALVAVCKTQDEKAILILTMDGKSGRLFEFGQGEVNDLADILVDKKGHLYFEEAANGGVYTYTVLQNRVDDLVKLPFRFVPSAKVDEILGMTSKAFCKDRPPEYK